MGASNVINRLVNLASFRASGGAVLVALLAGCVATPPVDESGYLIELPEGLAELAAEGQDIERVRLMEDDCYWYLYEGVVETTMLPILTTDGRLICNE
ncbi:hypothetical protein OE810_02790 [Rhodobacteraceae bacterium XHP0102]|nr:hypothetical protein [Rhodobacteraceae bacterium XHP0102]